MLLPHDIKAKALKINAFAQQYCKQHGDMQKPKDLLPYLTEMGVLDQFSTEYDLREILRQADDAGLLDELMPTVGVKRMKIRRWVTLSPNAGFFRNPGLTDNIIGYPVRSASQHIPDQLAGLGRRVSLIMIDIPHDLPTICPDEEHLLRLPASPSKAIVTLFPVSPVPVVECGPVDAQLL